ncbi:FecR family protein [Rhodoferax sp. OV413]|uniref:FecR family protein n=1 Tax=Rhodoferax sp. OV413 TaxID=1855285 RepID=UPI0008823419|nr:FecR family protein [Rhodoferax sp. OV413]SDO19372.1 FecR family protein [Rhodoferax sp. OV413]
MGGQTTHPTALKDPIAEQAAAWIVRLTADDEAECQTAQIGFEAWQQADPRHAEAAARMQGFIGQVQRLRESSGGNTQPAHTVLQANFPRERSARSRYRGKRVGALLTLVIALAVPSWLVLQSHPLSYLLADARSATGQWQTQTLPDGTRLTLGSASAVNLRFDRQRRTLELVRGEILVDVAHDPARPFVVETSHGSIRALGTKFVVQREANSTLLSMLESKVAVQTAAQRNTPLGDTTTVSAGQRLRISSNDLGKTEDISTRSISDAWKFHHLVVNDWPLAQVLDTLDRYRPGHIQYDRAQIAGIQVSAVLPLDDTDNALQLLLTSFPSLRIRTLTPYLVMVDAPGDR